MKGFNAGKSVNHLIKSAGWESKEKVPLINLNEMPFSSKCSNFQNNTNLKHLSEDNNKGPFPVLLLSLM